MEALRFVLKGRTAFFKNPEVNTYFYFTYGNIHKPALLGMFGAIMGFDGYKVDYTAKAKKKVIQDDYPAYYKKLSGLKVSVVPKEKEGIFPKKMQQFNNSVGYASKETGGNLIVREQWLEDPEWRIYLQLNDDISRELAQMILDRKCVYVPYLGKNDHPADICSPEIVTMDEIHEEDMLINSLSPLSEVNFDYFDMTYKYEEYLPIALKESTNHYEIKKFVLTDGLAESANTAIYSDGENNVVFY